MSVYVDNMLMSADVPNGNRTVSGKWSHLTADTLDELHAFAARIGLKRSWFQPGRDIGGKSSRSHYDVTERVRAKAIRLGAIPVRLGCEPWRDKKRRDVHPTPKSEPAEPTPYLPAPSGDPLPAHAHIPETAWQRALREAESIENGDIRVPASDGMPGGLITRAGGYTFTFVDPVRPITEQAQPGHSVAHAAANAIALALRQQGNTTPVYLYSEQNSPLEITVNDQGDPQVALDMARAIRSLPELFGIPANSSKGGANNESAGRFQDSRRSEEEEPEPC